MFKQFADAFVGLQNKQLYFLIYEQEQKRTSTLKEAYAVAERIYKMYCRRDCWSTYQAMYMAYKRYKEGHEN